MSTGHFPLDLSEKYEIHEWKHASAILKMDFPSEWDDLINMLHAFITRCDELQEIFNALGRGASYGNSTTHMSKLLPRIQGGGGSGCPLIVIGITKQLYEADI